MKVSFGTRLDPDLQRRLKIYAAATDQKIEDVVDAALRGHLPGIPAEAVTPGQQTAAAVS